MNIHKVIIPNQITKSEEILHLGNWYIRNEYTNKTYSWNTMFKGGYDIKTPNLLEIEYQNLINKPSTTTNEQPETCNGDPDTCIHNKTCFCGMAQVGGIV